METTEKRLWKVTVHSLKEQYHGGPESKDVPENYEDHNVFIWCRRGDASLSTNADWDDAETWLLNGMDGGPWGKYGTHFVAPADFSELTDYDIKIIRLFAMPDDIGTDDDQYNAAAVFMHRELLNAWAAWKADQRSAPASSLAA